MNEDIEDTKIIEILPIISPDLLKSEYQLTDLARTQVLNGRKAIRAILNREDERMLVILGPCSIHDEKSAIEYAEKLHDLKKHVEKALFIIMRAYFEKPRTTVGWKGFINDPHLNESYDINYGLKKSREILIKINEMGLSTATEFVDTITPQYLADLISWAAIGARSVESQTHRHLASGLSMPVGFKNSTSGSVAPALEAILAANYPHHFLSITTHGLAAIVSTSGNSDCSIVLRGGKPSGPNYAPQCIEDTIRQAKQMGVSENIIVDCSHENSNKDHEKQREVALSVLAQRVNGNKNIRGLMLESNLISGKQNYQKSELLTYGKSITDACIGWDETVEIIQTLAVQMRTSHKYKVKNNAK